MSPEDLAFFRARLEALEAALEGAGPHRLDPNRTDEAGRRDDDHQPLNEMLNMIASSRNRNRTAELARIKAALRRIDREPDEYGRCVDCDEYIKRRRLELMPAVEMCVGCQSATETPAGGRRRHLTDYR